MTWVKEQADAWDDRATTQRTALGKSGIVDRETGRRATHQRIHQGRRSQPRRAIDSKVKEMESTVTSGGKLNGDN